MTNSNYDLFERRPKTPMQYTFEIHEEFQRLLLRNLEGWEYSNFESGFFFNKHSSLGKQSFQNLSFEGKSPQGDKNNFLMVLYTNFPNEYKGSLIGEHIFEASSEGYHLLPIFRQRRKRSNENKGPYFRPIPRSLEKHISNVMNIRKSVLRSTEYRGLTAHEIFVETRFRGQINYFNFDKAYFESIKYNKLDFELEGKPQVEEEVNRRVRKVENRIELSESIVALPTQNREVIFGKLLV